MPRDDSARAGAHFHRTFGRRDATALVAGSMIGSGIFLVAAPMMRDLQSAGWLVLFYALTVAATFKLGGPAGTGRRALAVGYVLVAAAVMLDLLIVRPRFTWPGLLIVASGIPVYALWRRRAALS